MEIVSWNSFSMKIQSNIFGTFICRQSEDTKFYGESDQTMEWMKFCYKSVSNNVQILFNKTNCPSFIALATLFGLGTVLLSSC